MDAPAAQVETIAQSNTTDDDTGGFWQTTLHWLLDGYQVIARLEDKLTISINQLIKVPVHETLSVPITADIAVDTVVKTTVDLPLEIHMNAEDLGITAMEIKIDDQVYIDDTIEVDVSALMDSMIDIDSKWRDELKSVLPLQKTAKIQVKQPLRIQGTIKPSFGPIELKLKKNLTLDLAVPIKQRMTAKGEAAVKLEQDIEVPMLRALPITLSTPVKVDIKNVTLKPLAKDK